MIKIKDGENVTLTSIEKKILGKADFPLTEVCPMSLRYEMAKYDSESVKSAYAKIYRLYLDGKLVSE